MPSAQHSSTFTSQIDSLSALERLCDGVVSLFGTNCEAVIHDFADIEHSVVYVAGNVTNRAVGSPLTDLGVKTLIHDSKDQDILTYQAKSPDGNLLKSVSVILRNKRTGKPVGAVCFNFNVGAVEGVLRLLKELSTVAGISDEEEHFAADARSAIEQVMTDVLSGRGWLIAGLTREQAVQVVHDLDTRGVFAYRSAPTIVGELLGLSRYTIYKYLKENRK